MTRARSIFTSCLLAAAKRMPIPIAATLLGCWFGLEVVPPIAGSGRGTQAAAGLWLQLPGAALALVAVVAALEAWPLLSRERPGGRLLVRLRPPGAEGCLPAAAGALSALALALPLTALAFAALQEVTGRPPVSALPFHRLEVVGEPFVDAKHLSLQLRGVEGVALGGLRLSPLAFWRRGSDIRATRLQVLLDGVPVGEPLPVSGNREGISVPFTPRRVSSIELRAVGVPGVGLLFVPGAAEAIAVDRHSGWLNGVLASLCYLLPAALALALASTTRRVLALPVSAVVGGAVVLFGTLVDGTPAATAMAAYTAGRWLPAEPLASPLLTSAAATAALFAMAFFVHARRRR